MKLLALALALPISAQAQLHQSPSPAAAPWWNLTTALSADSMEGRDTGTAAYLRAAQLVADHLRAAGLKPAGENYTYFQSVPMHQVDLDTAHSSVELVDDLGAYTPLALLYDVTTAPRAGLPAHLEGKLVFLGYGATPSATDLHGKVAVFFNNTPADVPADQRAAFAASRQQALAASGAVATLSIDNPNTTEPSHWPAAYARTVSLINSSPAPSRGAAAPISMRISFESAGKLFAGTSVNAGKLLTDASNGVPLPSMPLARTLRLSLKVTEKDITSPNIIAILPGSDPKLASEYVALSAHLDGYGYGTPVLGDALYNGALDDAAYVATLLDLADQLHQHPPARSLLFCIFTGEEKGLLGSKFYTEHPTVNMKEVVADLNLDQLRPIFPLKILTMEGIADSTLGDAARSVAGQFSIELRPDREPERNLFRRADNYSFVNAGVPIASFIFGYNPGTPEERIYRDWYARRYHKPQDDLDTPIDWSAAVKFNDFYRTLALAVANNPTRPLWSIDSAYVPSRQARTFGSEDPQGCLKVDGKILKCH